jgi:5-methylcytosine-specific restriction endonuclease McrA
MMADCGTRNGFYSHKRGNQEPCLLCIEAKRAYEADYRLNNPEKIAAKRSKWKKNNPDKVRTYMKDYFHERPEMVRAAARKRRALAKGNGHEPYTEHQVIETYGTDCHICLAPIDLDAPRSTKVKGWQLGLHLDHLIPLAKSGSDTLDNIRPAHGVCNLKKHAAVKD